MPGSVVSGRASTSQMANPDEPSAKFGPLEVWTRKLSPTKARPGDQVVGALNYYGLGRVSSGTGLGSEGNDSFTRSGEMTGLGWLSSGWYGG
jgi:hypothetical protein